MMKTSIYKIDSHLSVPKYKQLVNNVINGIESGQLKRGDKIASLNQICTLNNMSRDTVMMAFNELKSRGVLNSQPGKGYFIQNTQIEIVQRIFVLFDELNSFKEDMYNSFLRHLDAYTEVDIYFHHFNLQVFSDLIKNAAGKYTSYVIMPGTFDHSSKIIGQLPADKVFILDRKKDDLLQYPTIFQDFENDVYEALSANAELLKKYDKIILVHPGGKEPEERVTGFLRFVNKVVTDFEVIADIKNLEIKKGRLYLVPSDRDLVKLIKIAEKNNFMLGTDVGVISFNDTVLKEVVAGGISAISTNFFEMGRILADMIKTKSDKTIRNNWLFASRNSI